MHPWPNNSRDWMAVRVFLVGETFVDLQDGTIQRVAGNGGWSYPESSPDKLTAAPSTAHLAHACATVKRFKVGKRPAYWRYAMHRPMHHLKFFTRSDPWPSLSYCLGFDNRLGVLDRPIDQAL